MAILKKGRGKTWDIDTGSGGGLLGLNSASGLGRTSMQGQAEGVARPVELNEGIDRLRKNLTGGSRGHQAFRRY